MSLITPEKIEEWIKEVQERPASAPMILQYIANRLRDLSGRNEELLAENIALLTGKRVEEYEQRIAHLEYQLELLKRQLGGDAAAAVALAAAEALAPVPVIETLNVLIYNAQGRVLRLALNTGKLAGGSVIGRLGGELLPGAEPPRLLAIPPAEELLFVFTSGRVATLPASAIPLVPEAAAEEALDWEGVPVPSEPRAGESLACLLPISKMPLAEFFVLVSRRGYVKKISASMSQTILANHYIGSAARQPADKTFEIVLCGKDDRLVLVSHQGYLQCREVKGLSYSTDEALRLGTSDHLTSGFVVSPGLPLLIITQAGKVIHWTDDRLEIATSLKTRGQPVFSSQRRESGVRVVAATSVSEDDWGAALHQDGEISLHNVRSLFATGTLPVQVELLAFAALPAAKVEA